MSLHKFYKIESNVVVDSKVVDSNDCFTNDSYDESKGATFLNNLESGTWVGDPSDVPAYTGKAANGSSFENNFFKPVSPHSSFVWSNSTLEWVNPVNPEPANDMVHFDFQTGVWVKVEIDSAEVGNIQNYNWDGSAWVLDADSVTPYDPASQPPNPYA